MEALEANRPARSVELNEDEAVAVRGLQLLTMKPLTYAANVGEDDLADQGASNHHVRALREKAAAEGCDVVVVSAQVRIHPNNPNQEYGQIDLLLPLMDPSACMLWPL